MKSRYIRHAFKRNFFDILAVLIVVAFFSISFLVMRHESATTDEQAHIPAAYSYVMLGDFTLNPEHPPLAKLIGGVGFIGSHYTFPTKLLHENTALGPLQWKVGNAFLYHSGNNPDSILMRSRLPILIASTLGLLICYLLFCALSSKKIALITLALVALSPTVIAHGHLVTTDVLVMTTTTIAILCFIRYLQKPSLRYGVIAGSTLALAELSKFSAALLFIVYVIVAVLYYYAHQQKTQSRKVVASTLKTLFPVYLSAILIIYVVYSFQVISLSHVAQNNWIINATGNPTSNLDARVLLKINEQPLAAPLVRYIVGFSSSLVRVAVGHGANLLGTDYPTGTAFYFPVISILKTPSPLLAVWLLMLCDAVRRLQKHRKKAARLLENFWLYVQTNPVLVFGGLFTIIYFVAACVGNLDIGIRHLLPLFPWVAFFSAFWIVGVLDKQAGKTISLGKMLFGTFIGLYVLIALIIFPNYIPYTTEIAGGAPQAYRYYNDSNVDWGQSIKYLVSYANQHPNILPLYTDQQFYDAKVYYFCGSGATGCSQLNQIKDSQKPPKDSYFAVSEMQLTIDWARQNDNLAYLKYKKPIAKIGDSIYLYHM